MKVGVNPRLVMDTSLICIMYHASCIFTFSRGNLCNLVVAIIAPYNPNSTTQYTAPPIAAAIGMVITHAVTIFPTSDHLIRRRL